jgi:hypothetical protein
MHRLGQPNTLSTITAAGAAQQPQRKNPFGKHMEKYWQQRYRLFVQFDQGIRPA